MYRARAAGLRGSYAPSMIVRHVIQAERMNKRYFRRWYYWNGISRALLYRDAWIDMQAPESTEVDFSRVPHILGVPRFFYRKAPREVRRWVTSAVLAPMRAAAAAASQPAWPPPTTMTS